MALDVDLRALPDLTAAEHVGVADDDPDAINDVGNRRTG